MMTSHLHPLPRSPSVIHCEQRGGLSYRLGADDGSYHLSCSSSKILDRMRNPILAFSLRDQIQRWLKTIA